jgi:hypothetical protein
LTEGKPFAGASILMPEFSEIPAVQHAKFSSASLLAPIKSQALLVMMPVSTL